MMRLQVSILLVLVLGCNDRTGESPTVDDPQLKPIELHYGIYLARHDLRITVSPGGVLRSVRTEGKSLGGNDVDPRHERIEVREGRLTAEQMNEVAGLFVNWDSLSSERYSGVADGGDVAIRYGDKTVSGGNAVPDQVTKARVRLTELAESMPVVKW